MPNTFAKDATKYYYKMRKTNKNYKFSNALKDWSVILKKGKKQTNKTMKNMTHTAETIIDETANGVADVVSELNPMKSVSHKKHKGRNGKSRRPRHQGTRRN